MNDQRFTKITFKTSDEEKDFYQVIGDDLIFIDLDSDYGDTPSDTKTIKTYNFFKKWINHQTMQDVSIVPMNDLLLSPFYHSVRIEVDKVHYIENSTGTILYIPITIQTELPSYLRNVTCEQTHISISNNSGFDYIEVNGSNTINLILQNPGNFKNKSLNMSIDVFEEKFLTRKVGRIEFEVAICSSSNPSID